MCSYGILFQRTQNNFETAVVNEPLVSSTIYKDTTTCINGLNDCTAHFTAAMGTFRAEVRGNVDMRTGTQYNSNI